MTTHSAAATIESWEIRMSLSRPVPYLRIECKGAPDNRFYLNYVLAPNTASADRLRELAKHLHREIDWDDYTLNNLDVAAQMIMERSEGTNVFLEGRDEKPFIRWTISGSPS